MTWCIGLMSGTSMDGVDAALVDLDTHTLLEGLTLPYPHALRHQLLQTQDSQLIPMGGLSQLNIQVGEVFATAAQQLLAQAKISAQAITAIGSHGQTLAHAIHAPIPYTLQLGCGHTIAERTGITTVADFRSRDVILGGQGAPFAPLYHQALWHRRQEAIAIVNIGGISNVTVLNASGQLTAGYDIGPGNILMDAWAQRQLGVSFDRNGEWAASGDVLPDQLAHWLSHPFFQQQPPKSACTSTFLQAFLPSTDVAVPQDLQATFLQLTAQTIIQAIERHHHVSPLSRVLICGGGVHNRLLMHVLQQGLGSLSVQGTQSLGIDPDFLEAMLFAWLADCALKNIKVDCTAITGSKKSSILGVIYPIRD